MGARLDRWLSRLTALLAVVCFATLVVTAFFLVVPSARALLFPGNADARGYLVGEKIDLPQHVYSGARHTLVLFATSSCAACLQSKETAHRIVDAVRERRSGTRVVLVTPRDGGEAEFELGTAMGLSRREVVGLEMRELDVAMVPTILLVDSEGAVVFVHEGYLLEETRKALLDAMTLLGA